MVPTSALPRSPGHPFYATLNKLLAEAKFDPYVEGLCEPLYRDGGRPSIPPGVFFRMLFIGYFEGIDSQRGIAWRCADSLSLRTFLGIAANAESPDHSSLSVIRERLPHEVHVAVFEWVLTLAREKRTLNGQTLGVDSTTLEANAAMKSIVRKDTGDDYHEYLAKLMREAGVIGPDDKPTVEELVRFDKSRGKQGEKKVSNDDWQSKADPDSRIAKMKDGTTHLAYKAEHAVDLDSEMIVAAEVYFADQDDRQTLEDTVNAAQTHLRESGSAVEIEDVVADKGYHSNEVLETFAEETPYRMYAAEPVLPQGNQRDWTDKPETQQAAFRANRRRVRGARGRKLQRQRSEKVERSFAHVCETGGARRTWLRGIGKVRKRYLIAAVAHNLGCLMRSLFGIGTPRSWPGAAGAWSAVCRAMQFTQLTCWRVWTLGSPVVLHRSSFFAAVQNDAPATA